MLSDYVKDVNNLIRTDSPKATIFDPKVNDSVISCYNIMNEYSKRTNKKKGVSPPPQLPKQVILKKRGEHSSATFKFGREVDQDTIDTVIDDLKIKNTITDTLDDGSVSLEIDK